MFGDQLKFGDGVSKVLECAHANVTTKYNGLALGRVLCTDCNEWINISFEHGFTEEKERGGESDQTSSEETKHVG